MFLPSPGLLTPSDTRPSVRGGYKYNPACGCEICQRGGAIPDESASAGHSFCYGEPHIPPTSSPFRPA